jgi:hypothetical protein
VSRRCQIRSPHPRVAATIALVPLIAGSVVPLLFLGDFLERHVDDLLAWSVTMLAPGLLFYLGYLLIWRRAIDWTPRRRLALLGIISVYAVLLLLAVGLPQILRWRTDETLMTLLSTSLLAAGLATWATARVCHDPPDPTKVPCPSCGYDLRGQRECRCPECGEQYTLGELLRRPEADDT